MPVNSTVNTVQIQGNGATTAFAFPLPFFLAADLVVTLLNTSTGQAVTPAPVLNGGATYDYTLALASVQSSSNNVLEFTGTVNFTTAPPANYQVTIQRVLPVTQNLNLIDNSKFPSSVVNAALDRLTMIAQQLGAVSGLSLQIPASDPPGLATVAPSAAVRASLYAGWDGSGNFTALAAPVGSAVSAAMAPVIVAATLAAALALLGGLAGGAVNTPAALTTLKSTTAGAAAETFLTLLRNKGAGAASDFLERLAFDGMNAATTEKTFAALLAQIVTATAGSEAGALLFQTIVAGALTTGMTLQSGLQLGAPTGGDKGAGSLNAQSLYLNGAAVGVPALTKSFVSAQQTITAAGALTIAHGLGVAPAIVLGELVNVTGELGYTAGQTIPINLGSAPETTISEGISVRKDDATNLIIRFGTVANVFAVIHATTGSATAITAANWKLVLRAFA